MNNSKRGSKTSFEMRLDILLYAAHSTGEFTVKDLSVAAVDTKHFMTIRNCLSDLIECGYLIRKSTYKFQATDLAKQLFGVQG